MSKAPLNISVGGHLSCGKSTLIGQLLLRVGSITKKQIEANEKDAALVNKRSYKYAWVVDTLPAERQKGMTIEIHTAQFQTSKFSVAVTNCPGHKKYQKNAIAVDASTGAFETGMGKEGQTREHAQLAFMLGVRQAVVVVTKMDNAAYDAQRFEAIKAELLPMLKKIGFNADKRFEAIKAELLPMLKKIGFNADKVPVIPVCGWSGDNLVDRVKTTTRFSWFDGPTLTEALDSLEVMICPTGELAEVSCVEVDKKSVSRASAGQNVGFSLKTRNLDHPPHRGFVICDAEEPAAEVSSFQVQVFITVAGSKSVRTDFYPISGIISFFSCFTFACIQVSSFQVQAFITVAGSKGVGVSSFQVQVFITVAGSKGVGVGFTPILDIHTSHTPCSFHNLVSKLDRKTGKEIEKDPKILRNGDVAIVDLAPLSRLVVEPFADYPPLGRFVLRDGTQIVGFGIVKSVTRKQHVVKE
eukprot:gene11256-18878_t